MSIVRSDDYRAAGAEAAEILLQQQEILSEENKIALSIQVKRTRVLRKVEALTGLRFSVDRKAPKGVAGYMLIATGEVSLAEESLDDEDWAKYVGYHEANHVHTQNCHLDFEENVPADQFKALKDELAKKKINIKEINWTEGFNDLKTINTHGKNDNSGYLQKEVPAAEKLDDLCI